MSKPTYYDDNFGEWNIESEDDVQFYHHIQDTNVSKQCERCGRTVSIQPHYAVCNPCADAIERGIEY